MTGVQEEDLVTVRDRAEAVGDRDGRDAPTQSLDSFLDGALADTVERTRGLVEDQQLRSVEERSGDGDPLPLATRCPRAALTERRIEASLQASAPLEKMGRTEAVVHPLVVHVLARHAEGRRSP